MIVKKSRKIDLKIRPEDMRIFVAIGRARTLTEASEALRIPLFTASRALKRIERMAQLALIRRDESGLHLTEVGHEYLKVCQSVLQAHQVAMEVLLARQLEPEGLLHVAAPVTFVRDVLSLVLCEFLEPFPKLRVKVSLCSDPNQEPDASHDVFLKVRMPSESRYQMKLFPSIRQGVFASPQYLADHSEPEHPLELNSHTHECLAFNESEHRAYWKFWQNGEHLSVNPATRIIVPDPRTLARLAIDSAGLTVLPLWMAREHVTRGELVQVLTDWTVEPVVFCALYNGRPRGASKEGAFLNFLASILGGPNDPRCAGADPSDLFVHGSLEKDSIAAALNSSTPSQPSSTPCTQ